MSQVSHKPEANHDHGKGFLPLIGLCAGIVIGGGAVYFKHTRAMDAMERALVAESQYGESHRGEAVNFTGLERGDYVVKAVINDGSYIVLSGPKVPPEATKMRLVYGVPSARSVQVGSLIQK